MPSICAQCVVGRRRRGHSSPWLFTDTTTAKAVIPGDCGAWNRPDEPHGLTCLQGPWLRRASPNRESRCALAPLRPERYAATMWCRQWAVILGAWLVWGCGARSETQEAYPGYSTAREFCEAYELAVLEYNDRCFTNGRGYYLQRHTGPSLVCDSIAAEVEAKRMVYYPALSGSCVAQMRQRECGKAAPRPETCDTVLVGRLPEGHSCAIGGGSLYSFRSCAPGTYCDSPSHACPSCQAYAKLGESCVDLERHQTQCEKGSRCQLDGGVCVREAGEGEPCGGDHPRYCEPGLTCMNESIEEDGRCFAAAPTGDCRTSLDCAPGYLCRGSDWQTCTKAKKAGEQCFPGEGECDFADSTCGSDGWCVELGELKAPGLGEACGYAAAYPEVIVSCQLGLYCSTTDDEKVCRPMKPVGSSCTDADRCLGTYAYCDPETQRCVSCD